MNKGNDKETIKKLAKVKELFFLEVEKTIIGQKDVLNHILISLLCNGHILLVGVPGLAKTLMIKTLAKMLDLNFNRIQFTPDLMPSDITGTEVIEQNRSTGKRSFKFFKGPIFTNILLALKVITFLLEMLYSSLVFGFLPILLFLLFILNVPKL